MKIKIYLQIEGKKKLWFFHELVMKDEDFRAMIGHKLFRGFRVIEPMHTNLLTTPTQVINGFPSYQADVEKFILLPFDDEVVAICKLNYATQ